jgi:predicted RNase H-like HicB family nuclease
MAGTRPAMTIREVNLMADLDYPVIIEPLPPEVGDGFAAIVPDLPGCMSDGETPEDALANVRDAIAFWIEEAKDIGPQVPRPSKHLAAAELRPTSV